MPNLISSPPLEPRLPGQQAEIVPGSPLALIALITAVVRQRFSAQDSGLPWVWNENPTPESTETNEPDAARKIVIEPAYAVHSEVRNYRPSIYIDRADVAVQQVATGHLAGQDVASGARAHYALAFVPIIVEVISDQAGESATIADLVWFYLLAGRDAIAKTFGLHDVSNPTLGRTTPFEQDKDAWSTTVSMNITLHLRWGTVPIAPLLKDVVLKYRDSQELDPNVFLLKNYVR